MNLEMQIQLLAVGVLAAKAHLETLYGDFGENLEAIDMESKEFLFGHITGMLEILQQLVGEEEE